MQEQHVFIRRKLAAARIVDQTRFGYILQHESHDALRLDVRFCEKGGHPARDGQPSEVISPDWETDDTFFRHEDGHDEDPRTGMTYDVTGFIDAYTPLRPGPNAVVSGVWLEDIDNDGIEYYAVLVARRNPGEDMWPDHTAVFARDSASGEWFGIPFEPADIANWRSQ